MDCGVCGKTFKSLYYVARHMKQVHKVIVGPLKKGPPSQGRFSCHHCGGNWTRKTNLKKHLNLVHKLNDVKPELSTTACPYDFCGVEFKGSRKSLSDSVREHILTAHSVGGVALISKQFSNIQDFREWKHTEEKIERVKFIQNRGMAKSLSKIVMHFYCNRSGHPRKTNSSKSKCSLKLGSFCPAKITATANLSSGEVDVKYFNIHVGHTNIYEAHNDGNIYKKRQKSKTYKGIVEDERLNKNIVKTVEIDANDKDCEGKFIFYEGSATNEIQGEECQIEMAFENFNSLEESVA